MSMSILTGAMVMLLTGTVFAADREGSASLEGTWEATAVTQNGKEAPADEVKKHILTVKGDQFNYEMFRTIVKGKMKLKSATTPMEIDIVQKNSGRKGIYERKGDVLRLCLPTRKGARPTELTGKEGFQLTVFKKVK